MLEIKVKGNKVVVITNKVLRTELEPNEANYLAAEIKEAARAAAEAKWGKGPEKLPYTDPYQATAAREMGRTGS